mgnify:CR=1 FL=1
MQQVLVTGGTGFLGSHLVKRLVADENVEAVVVPSTKIRANTSLGAMGLTSPKISLLEGDVRDFDFLQKLFAEYEFDTVFHLGAMSEVRKCQANSKLAFDVNIGGTVNLLETIRLYGKVKRIIVSSSDKAYGEAELPYKETDPLAGNGIYEASKSCQDLVARSYHFNFGMPVVVTRCSNLYGPFDMNVSRIVPNTIRLIRSGKAPVIWKGSEASIREFLYVEEAVDAYLALAEHIDVTKGQAYNVGSGQRTEVKELVEELISILDTSMSIDYQEKSFPEITHQYLDSTKIARDTGWTASVSLADGLGYTVAQA